MSIPEAQLEIWSHQGSIQQSAATYAAIKSVLERQFAGKVDIFLQGSYGNDTNVYGDSDVDIVLLYTAAYYRDLSALPPEEAAAYNAAITASHPYNFVMLRQDVETALRQEYGNAVATSNKAIRIAAGGGRRDADVVPSFAFRRYLSFKSVAQETHVEGLTFWARDGQQVVNYPRLHSANLTLKHQATGGAFKPTVRIYKNLRNALDAAGLFKRAIAPSYFIENMLYNAPNSLFIGPREEVVARTLGWLVSANNRENWTTASGQHYLIRDGASVCWPANNCGAFLAAALAAWNNW